MAKSTHLKARREKTAGKKLLIKSGGNEKWTNGNADDDARCQFEVATGKSVLISMLNRETGSLGLNEVRGFKLSARPVLRFTMLHC